MVVFAVQLGIVRAAEPDFSRSVTPADYEEAGLSTLTPKQLTRLNALVDAYKSGALAAAQRATADALAAKLAAEDRSARSEAKAEAVKNEAAKAKQEKAGFLARAKVILMPGAQVEVAVIESTIPGKFQGWQGREIFTLANGQRWQIATGGEYYSRAVQNPKVQILPAAIAGYWLRFPDLDTQVRVNLVGEK